MIVKMDKLRFLVYHKEYETFVNKLRELGVIHVEIRQTGEMDPALQTLIQQYSTYKNILKEMNFAAMGNSCQQGEDKKTAQEVIEGFHSLQQSLQQKNQQIPSLEREIAQLKIWGEFDWKTIDQLRDNGWFVQFFTCPEKSFEESWKDEYQATIIQTITGQCYFITINSSPINLEAEKVILPSSKLSDLMNKKSVLEKEVQNLRDQFSLYCASKVPVIESAMLQLQGEIDLLKVQLGGEKMADGAIVLLEGWAPEENAAEIRSMLEENGIYYEMRPAEKEDDAPIKLKNNKVTGFFEMLTRMYGLPEYGEFDPTPMLAPFYALFFGLCVGDAGYGLFLVALGFYLKKKLGKSMSGIMNLVITLGIATTVIGALVGTFFGVELVKLDLPEWLTQIMITGKLGDTSYDKTMVFALIVGMIHICFAMTIKAICSTVRYGFKNSLSAWGWLLLVGGTVSTATLHFIGVLSVDTSKIILLIIGIVSAIGIYLLNNIRRNIFVNVGAGLWDTYNMATGLMGDILSYLRLYALGLAGGMLGGVFNMLGLQLQESMSDVLWGIPGWICFGLIFVFGHSLNIALSCLSAYVHSIRLSFVEYFKNSGYIGRGKTYKPFSITHDKQ